MNIYYIILIALLILDLGIAIGTHGNERGPVNANQDFIAFVLGATLLTLAVLN